MPTEEKFKCKTKGCENAATKVVNAMGRQIRVCDGCTRAIDSMFEMFGFHGFSVQEEIEDLKQK